MNLKAILQTRFGFSEFREGQAEKLAWLAHLLNHLPGSGLIYTATRHSSELVASFLQAQGYPVRYYHAGLSEERVELEAQLQRNALKALACTNALGMGLDKPDLRFVIHYEMPASPIHYYQEIGRAGRDGVESYCILLAHPDDIETQRSMICSSRPDRQAHLRIYSLLQTQPMRERELLLATGLPQHATRAILYDLQDQGLITRDAQRHYRAISRQAPNFDHYDALLHAFEYPVCARAAQSPPDTAPKRVQQLCAEGREHQGCVRVRCACAGQDAAHRRRCIRLRRDAQRSG